MEHTTIRGEHELRRRGDQRRVLVVDDNRMVRRFVAENLGRCGYSIAEAQDGAQALEVFLREPAQVVITDIGMPRLGGLELLAALRRQTAPPEVILLTGSHADDTNAAVQALRLGAHDYIEKSPAAGAALALAVERALDKRRLREENTRLLQELRRLTLTDGLTGVGNRRAFDDALEDEVSRARDQRGVLSLVILDIDCFKRVNDSFGHPVGDQVLVGFVERVRSIARETDLLFRYGGEEFAFLGDMTAAGALVLAARAVQGVAAKPLAVGRRILPITCSAGVAELREGDSGAELMARADEALYLAKSRGRNRAVSASELGRPKEGATLEGLGWAS